MRSRCPGRAGAEHLRRGRLAVGEPLETDLRRPWDPEHVFVERQGVTAVPFVVAVAPGGRIRDRFLGPREDVDLERLGRLTTE